MERATSVYTDFSGLAELKVRAGRDTAGTATEVARQFESLLMGQMLKSMRQASLAEGILDNDQSRFYQEMFDQQLSLHLVERGGMGLAAAIERQLDRELAGPAGAVKGIADYRRRTVAVAPPHTERPDSRPRSDPAASPGNGSASDPGAWNKGEFVRKLWPWALEAARQLGLEPQALLAQAALETGWGRHMIRRMDGSPSHNLFGIKADSHWQGDRVSVGSLEYEQGVAVRRRSAFRAYDSFRASFNDYVDFMKSNPRYAEALASTTDSRRYFSALQQAGYATDPSYADKIDMVLQGEEMHRALERFKPAAGRPL